MPEKASVSKNRKLYKSVMADFEDAREDRRAQEKVWRDAEDMLYGNHWKHSNMPRHKSKVVINTPFEGIETVLPVITARDPEIEISPRLTPDIAADDDLRQDIFNYADGVSKEIKEIWRDGYLKRKNRERFRATRTYGNGVFKSVKIPGQQRIETEVVDIFSLFPAPGCYNVRDCEGAFLIHAPKMSIGEVKRRWKLKQIGPDGSVEDYASKMFHQQSKDESGELLSPVGDTTGKRFEQLEERGDSKEVNDADEVIIIERWKFDDSLDKDGNPLYPSGRVTVVTPSAPEWILFDGPNVYPHYPFFMTKNYSESKSFWGRPDSRQTNTIIKTRNMIVSQVTDWLRLTANPVGVRTIGAGVKAEQITNEPGSYIDALTPDGFHWQQPPNLHIANAIAFLHYLDAKEDNIQGIQDAWRGKAAGASESAKHADVLRAQSASRIQPAVEEMVESLREMAEHWCWIIKNLWNEEVVHEIHDEESGSTTFRPFLGVVASPGAGIYGSDVDTRVNIDIGSMLVQDEYSEFEETTTVLTTEWPSPDAAMAAIDAAPNIRNKEMLKKVMKGVFKGDNSGIPEEHRKILESTDKQAIFNLLQQHPEYQELYGGESG